MKIEHIDIYTLDVNLTEPTKIPIGIIDAARNIAIKITVDNGQVGWGEGSPFAPITGDSQAGNFHGAAALARLIKGKDPLAIGERMAEINRVAIGEPSLRSAFDMAFYDIASKAANMPLYQFLGGCQRELHTDLTIGLQETVEDTLRRAKQILSAGFNAIKLKVGRPNQDDVPHVTAVRKLVGADVAIKMDSNQGWDFPTAVANIKAMQPLNIQYSEQPLADWDVDNLARLRREVDLPICADESVFDHHDTLKLIKAEAVDYLNIKLAKSGGIHTALKINAIAEAAGVKCMIGCFAETRLALGAAAHLAMACPNIQFIDLDSAYKHKEDPVVDGMTYSEQGGLLNVPTMPGHGAAFEQAYLSKGQHISI